MLKLKVFGCSVGGYFMSPRGGSGFPPVRRYTQVDDGHRNSLTSSLQLRELGVEIVDQRDPKLSRREARDLDIEIGFLEGLVRRDPAYVEALELLGDHYTLRGRAHDSLTIDERLRSLRPDDPNVRFNLACSLALSGDPERACHELEKALELGFRDFRALQRDPDLAAARKHSAFKKVRAKIKTLKSEA